MTRGRGLGKLKWDTNGTGQVSLAAHLPRYDHFKWQIHGPVVQSGREHDGDAPKHESSHVAVGVTTIATVRVVAEVSVLWHNNMQRDLLECQPSGIFSSLRVLMKSCAKSTRLCMCTSHSHNVERHKVTKYRQDYILLPAFLPPLWTPPPSSTRLHGLLKFEYQKYCFIPSSPPHPPHTHHTCSRLLGY